MNMIRTFTTPVHCSLIRSVMVIPVALFGSLDTTVADLSSGLVAHLPLNGNASDVSGNCNHGNSTPSVLYGIDRLGVNNSAAVFDGTTNTYVDVPTLTTFQYRPATYSAWFKLTAYLPPQTPNLPSMIMMPLMGRERCYDGREGALILGSESGYGYTNVLMYYTGSSAVHFGRTPSLQTWTHVVMTIDSDNRICLYYNGDKVADKVYSYSQSSQFMFRIGGPAKALGGTDYGHGRYFWNGMIDDVRIYNRALSSTETSQLYNETPTHLAPHITNQPTNAIVNAEASVTFSVNATGDWPLSYQWCKNNVIITGATNSTLTMGDTKASDSGYYSVSVANTVGNDVTSASAKLTVLGGEQYSQAMCRMPDPVAFEKLPGQDSLIVITHGWQPLGALADVSWMEDMADAIGANLAIQGKTNWRVETFNWSFFAWPDPESALVNGNTLGSLLGMQLGLQSWSHIHLIGHSAGSAVIQCATEWIKCLSDETTVHATYLDPYIGRYSIGRLWYGLNADWADNYFSDDWTGNLTGGRLLHTHNVNVTQLDPDHTGGLPCFYSGSEMPSSTPAVVSSAEESSHPYPHDFYLSTIELRCSPEAEGYGFPLSKEGGGWDNHAAYIRGNDPKILGDPAVCLPDTVVGGATGTAFNFSSLTRASSATGATVLSSALQLSCIQSTPNGLGMSSFSQDIGPLSENANTAWLSAAVTVTDIVNFVTFDISFASPANAQGLLTVYWETNVVGTVDERTVMAATENYRIPLQKNYSAGTYALGFRLDSFTNITSSVIVTNVAAGFAGNTAPISLDVAATTNGMFMTLSAPSQQNYLVQASTNLVDWSPFAILANTNGAVRFYDPDKQKYKQRFYRAVKP